MQPALGGGFPAAPQTWALFSVSARVDASQAIIARSSRTSRWHL
jgi:hypothetical protein